MKHNLSPGDKLWIDNAWKEYKAAGTGIPVKERDALEQCLVAFRIQANQLEQTIKYGGPSEISGALDAVDYAVNELRSLMIAVKPEENP